MQNHIHIVLIMFFFSFSYILWIKFINFILFFIFLKNVIIFIFYILNFNIFYFLKLCTWSKVCFFLCSSCWYCVNWMQACLTSPESDRLLSCTTRCLDRWFEHAPPKLKSESSESESNFLNGYVCAYIFHVSEGVLIERIVGVVSTGCRPV